MNSKIRNIVIVAVAALVVGSLAFMFIISPIKPKQGNKEMPTASSQTDEITSEIVVQQQFTNITEDISEVAVVFNRLYELGEDVYMVIELLDGNEILASEKIVTDTIEGSHRTYLRPTNPISGFVGKELTLKIYTTSTAGTGLTLMIDANDKSSSFLFGSQTLKGTICFSITGKE